MNLYKFIQRYDDDVSDVMQDRMNELIGLNEHKRDASTKNARLQSQMKYLYEKR